MMPKQKSFFHRQLSCLLFLLGLYALWFIYCVYTLHSSMPGKSKSNIKSAQFVFDKYPNDGTVKSKTTRSGIVTKKVESGMKGQTPKKALTLTAYLEPPVQNWKSFESDQPMPPRSSAKKDLLVKMTYGNGDGGGCTDIPASLPVDSVRYANLHPRKKLKSDTELLIKQAESCPSDADPFLPWIHDVFPSRDGMFINFIAQNKRMCNTGDIFADEAQRLEPQVSLLQPVPLKRVSTSSIDGEETRYRLSTIEDADEDGKETRFICVFHGTGEYENVYFETLSVYPFNYETVTLRKNQTSMLKKNGKDKGQFWQSNIVFDCPVPESLQQIIRDGESVVENIASLYIDIVPIRTPARFNKFYLPLDVEGDLLFDAEKVYGTSNLIPRIVDSGRWENIPICQPPSLNISQSKLDKKEETQESDSSGNSESEQKKHELIACIWASASYTTRGSQHTVGDGGRRLKEWIAFHQLVGFDHFYIYDNTLAHTAGDESATLKSVTDLFPDFVTHINWPTQVCNNSKPKAWNPGERSSQYAAEASCRQRYGPDTEWLASFDSDEYMVPMGDYYDLKDMLRDAKTKGANILSFKSTRAYPRVEFMKPYHESRLESDLKCGKEADQCLDHDVGNELYLQLYNCDTEASPKPGWAMRAKKQIYRPDYVLHHFVHYSTVTKGLVDSKQIGRRRYTEDGVSERFTDELKEAVLLHTKKMLPHESKDWKSICKGSGGRYDTCHVGFKWPQGLLPSKNAKTVKDSDGFIYNCFPNDRIEEYWIPKLKAEMMRLNEG